MATIVCHELKADFRVRWLIGAFLAALVPIGVVQMARAAEEQGSARGEEGPVALTVSGALEDALFGKPIKGAKLTITKFDKPRSEGGKEIEQIQALTDEEGKYRFQLPTDRAWKVPLNEQLASTLSADAISAYTAAGIANYDAFLLDIEIRHPDYAPLRTELTLRRIPSQLPSRATGPIGPRASLVYGRIAEIQAPSRFVEGFGQPAAPDDPNLRLLTTLELRTPADDFANSTWNA
jgi:hypothetical protein